MSRCHHNACNLLYFAHLVDVNHGAGDSSNGSGTPEAAAVGMKGAGGVDTGSDGKAVK